MAYRNNIHVICGKSAAKAFRKVNRKYNYFDEIPGKNEEFLFMAQSISWDKGDSDIDEYIDIIESYTNMSPEDVPLEDGLEFLRTGESTEDVEVLSNDGILSGLCLKIETYGFEPLKASKEEKYGKATSLSPK